MASDTRSLGGTAAAGVAVTVWGLGPVIVRSVSLSGLLVAFWRLWIGVAFMVALVLVRRGRLGWATLRAAAAGGTAFGLDIVLFFVAVKLTSVVDATFISALQPALVLVLAGRLFGERVTRTDLAWTGLAIVATAGVVAGSAAGAHRTLAGDAIAAAALLAWTWYFVASKRARRTLGAVEYQAAMNLVAALVVSPLALAAGALAGDGLRPSGRDAALLVVMVLGPGTGHFLMNWAHGTVPILVSSLLTLATPVVSAAAAAILLGEPVTAVQVVSMAVVLGALAAVILRATAATDPPPAEAVEVDLPV